jgi:MarR family 2-MHQ and catechol resistance regulon transcriptional repressor
MANRYKGTPREELALSTYVKLMRASGSLEGRVFRRLAEIEPDLTVSQFGVLEALLHVGPMCQSDLGQRILRSSGNMTLVIDNLERRGLVRRERSSQDRRFVTVILTPEGERLIRKIFPGHAAAITDQMSVLNAAEQRTLGELCRRLGRGGDAAD